MKEIVLRKEYLQDELVDTIYFGGGTPSLLDGHELASIMEAVYRHYRINPAAEVTFESNPDDISLEKARSWKNQGINRLSIGIQSFFEEDLIWMNRAHNAKQALDCIGFAQQQGINNISIDLIYGGPTLPDIKWEENLSIAIALQIPHLSCYALTVEPGTPLDALTRKKKMTPVSSDDQARQFLILTDTLQSKGYEHYEISNFALPGKRSQHNSSYWRGKTYLGLGPSAHSFNGSSRQWNLSNNALYIQSLNNGLVPFEIENLSETQRFNEYILTALRTIEGVSKEYIKSHFNQDMLQELDQSALSFLNKDWLTVTDQSITLTREGKLFADKISSALFAESPVV